MLIASKKMARNFLLWMILIVLQINYTLQENETISGDSSETVDIASILTLDDIFEETTISISDGEPEALGKNNIMILNNEHVMGIASSSC